jgi:hypothetical protein
VKERSNPPVPIAYTVEPTRNRVTLVYTGTITDRELFETFDRLYRDPAHRVGMDELSDLRTVHNVTVTSVGLQALADQTARNLDQARQTWRVAVVAPQDVVFGLARMYGLFREDSPELVRVFRDLASAEEWLASP